MLGNAAVELDDDEAAAQAAVDTAIEARQGVGGEAVQRPGNEALDILVEAAAFDRVAGDGRLEFLA